jgi:hypothetical protein
MRPVHLRRLLRRAPVPPKLQPNPAGRSLSQAQGFGVTDSDLLPILSQLLNVLGCGMVVVLLVSRPRR